MNAQALGMLSGKVGYVVSAVTRHHLHRSKLLWKEGKTVCYLTGPTSHYRKHQHKTNQTASTERGFSLLHTMATMEKPASVPTPTLRPSLKRSYQEAEEGNRSKALRSAVSFNVLSAGPGAQRTATLERLQPAGTYNLPFAFPIINSSAFVDDSSETDSSDDDHDDSEEEAAFAAAARKHLMSVSLSRSASAATLSSNRSSHSQPTPSTAGSSFPAGLGAPPTAQQRKNLLHKAKILSESAPAFHALLDNSSSSTKKSGTTTTNNRSIPELTKPDDYLRDRLERQGMEFQTVSALDIPDFFLPLSDQVDGYDMEIVSKVRAEDIEGLREMLRAGRSMQVSNKFGDSLVHMACRRGSIPLLKFFLEEARVSCKVCCDSGRTPLHDACWTSVQNVTIVEMILQACPDLLYITDKRGFTPLNYARTSHWAGWCDFLKEASIESLTPKEVWKSESPKN